MSETISGNPGSSPVPEDTRDLGGNSSSPVATLQLQTEGEELWTMEEMEEAEPCNIIEIDEDALKAQMEAASQGVSVEGGGMIVEGCEPELEDADIDTQATSGGYNYPGPFTRFEVFDDYRVYPYRCVGKLFFKRGGRSYVCSASSIGGNAIWTAGHCLHAGNNSSSGWATNVVFVPAYKDGAAPYGQWKAKQLFVRTAWYRNGIPNGLCQDMGGAILYPRNNRKISQVVGWLGFAWNWSRYQHWCQFGYPAGSPFNGRRLIENCSSYAYNGSVNCSPKPVGVGSDLTGGSSGGPWILKFGTKNYVNGCNSYRRSRNSQEMFSPYFNNNAKSLFDQLLKG
ncbi:MAG: hypothetical protein QNJ42_00300 [Crocosphaera sp.]|nr:hypothetical protein [Crocosphaera sp.]